MKKQKVILLALTSLMISCNESTTDEVKETTLTEESQDNLNQESEDLKVEIEMFKKETEEKIVENEQSLIEFNARIDDQKKEAKAEYEAEIKSLNNQNTDMKKRIADFQSDNRDKWEAFKIEFSSDMIDLGKAFMKFTKNEE